MSERDGPFELDDDFLAEHEESSDFDRILLDRVSSRPKQANIKKGKAAWSKLEDVLADRRLEKELEEFFDEDKKSKSK